MKKEIVHYAKRVQDGEIQINLHYRVLPPRGYYKVTLQKRSKGDIYDEIARIGITKEEYEDTDLPETICYRGLSNELEFISEIR